MPIRLIEAVVTLDKVISERRLCSLKIDHECQEAIRALEVKVKHISSKKPDPSSVREKKEKYTEEEKSLKGRIRSLEKDKEEKEKQLSEIKILIDTLTNDKDTITRQIDNRTLFDSIVKFIFGDSEKKKKAHIENAIDTETLRREHLAEAINYISKLIFELDDKISGLRARLTVVKAKLIDIENQGLSNVKQLANLRKEHKKHMEQFKVRKESINHNFEVRWTETLKDLDLLCKRIRARQPHLNELSNESINKTFYFPDALSFGRIRIMYEKWRGYIPRLLPFPFKKSLWIPVESKDSNLIVNQFLLRVMTAIPANSLKIMACDPLNLGKSLNPFLPLLNTKNPFPEQRVLTRSDEIEKILERETTYVEDVLQKKFKGDKTCWYTYNQKHPQSPLPFKILLLFGIPEQMTDKSLLFLGRLLEHGPQCGLLPVLTIDEARLEDRKFSGLKETINKFSAKMDCLFEVFLSSYKVRNIKLSEESEFWPDPPKLSGIVDQLVRHYCDACKFSRDLEDIWSSEKLWGELSKDGLYMPIGWTHDGEMVTLALGGANNEQHALLAGKTNTGKSNLLHVLIHSLCHRYSPSEVRIFLLDYKQATEFNTYANPILPQAALVATESDPEYGISVLSHIAAEIKRRSDEFKRCSVRDLSEYRNQTGKILPRILLIIDEFQVLFSEGRHTAEPSEKLLVTLLRQGRAYGIHLLLSTQTLRGIPALAMGQLVSQIGCRICLACTEEDSSIILGGSNWEGAMLDSPPEALLNDANGAKSANRRFLVPKAERDVCIEHQQLLSKSARGQGYQLETKIFDGAHLPELPSENVFRDAVALSTSPVLLIGEELNYESPLLSISLENRQGANLLIAGFDNIIQRGLINSTILSLALNKSIQEIIYFDARSGETPFDEIVGNMEDREKISIKQPDWNCDTKDIPFPDKGKFKVLIINGLDSVKILQGNNIGYRPLTPVSAESPADIFRKLVQEGARKGFFVIGFVDNWRRYASQARELLPYFELRIGFCLNEEDAGTLLNGNSSIFKGLEKSNRAVFADILKNRHSWMRPFGLEVHPLEKDNT